MHIEGYCSHHSACVCISFALLNMINPLERIFPCSSFTLKASLSSDENSGRFSAT